jgi:outer membrane receptor protein involved in Fe transport
MPGDVASLHCVEVKTTMNKRVRKIMAMLAAASTWPLAAQTAAPAPATAADETEETVIQLSPFEVSATLDTGYQATQTLAGTRIRTDLKDVGSAISVITKDFLQDVGATDSSTLLQYTTNAEVAGTRGTYAGLGNATGLDETGTLRAPGSAQRVRGLAAADNTRDFFVTDIPWDAYNVDRIDIQRGPNSILFGLGSPAGIVNASTRNAEFRNLGSVEARFGSYDSMRASIDVNQELIDNVLAIRFDALWNDEKYKQDPAFQEDKRVFGAIRFDPQLFKDRSWHTSIRAKFEHGEIDANRPRITPPNDSITPWFRPVDNGSLNGGMGKLAITASDAYSIGAATSTLSPWLSGGGIDQQQPVWFIDGVKNSLDRIYGGYVNTGARLMDGTVRGVNDSLVGQRYSQPFFGINSLGSYASIANLPGSTYGQYRTASLQDPTVFDFYNQLIDGPTKKEFEKWDAYNIDFQQTAFDDRIGVQLSYDRQKYKRGGEALIGSSVNSTPTLTIDFLRSFQDFGTNPNFGRPYVLGGPGGGDSYESERKYTRGSLFGELRANDFLKSEFLVKLLGKHRFNGVYSDEKYETETRRWQMYANNRAWDSYWTRADGNLNGINNRPPVAVIYLGPSIANQDLAAGAHIPGIAAPITLADGNLYYFDATWKNPTGVNFSDPWTVPANLAPMFNTDATNLPAAQNGVVMQNSNPANYVGWNTNYQMNLLRYNDGQDLGLLRNAAKTLRTTKSYAGTWQGFLWNDAIVPTLGWRYDEVKGKNVTAASVSNNRAMLNLNQSGAATSLPYALPQGATGLNSNQSYSLFKDHSTSGGIVVHLNKILEKDPLPINVSLSYNKSNNFQVTNTRRDVYGNVIGNPSGATKDYGVLLSTKDGKYSLRALKYETSLTNADTQLDASGLTNTIKNGLNWRNIMLYHMTGYAWSTVTTGNNIRFEWIPAYVNQYGRTVWSQDKVNATPSRPAPEGSVLQTEAQSIAQRDASIRSWNEIQAYLQEKGYFTAWNYGAGPTTLSALTDRATYEANPSAYQPDPTSVYDYRNNSNLQGFAVTADTKSEGYEFEFTANPLPNWRIAFNAAKTTAVRNNVGGELLDGLVEYMTERIGTATVPGAAGDMIMFNAHFDDPTNVIWNNGNWKNFRSGYTLMKLQEGAAASELRKWRYNVVTNYSFTHGRLKGLGIGGGYRWQDKVVIGYPVLADERGLATFDLTKPYYGPSEDAIDLWISYERKLTNKIGWKIQANVRNLGKEDGLVPISVQPDGRTWAGVRMQPTEEWFVTNTFTF